MKRSLRAVGRPGPDVAHDLLSQFAGDWAMTGEIIPSSLDSILWTYRGQMDENERRLTWETEGPSALHPGSTAPYRETLQMIDSDRKVITSSVQDDDGMVFKPV